MTAPNDFTEIPDSSYTPVLDTSSIFLGDAGDYSAATTVTQDGPVDMTLDRYVNSAIPETATFFAPDVTAGAKLTLSLPDGAALGALRLQVDLGGDGTIDQTLSPFVTTGATTDSTAPTTIAGANQDDLHTSSVTLLAHDDDSGVGATYYWIDGAAQPTVYTKPFDAQIGSTVTYQSIDKAGNLEDPKQLVVDDASDDRQLAATITFDRPLLRFLDPQGDEDWFTFQANGRSTYAVRLFSLPADYDLELVDANGNVVMAGHGRGVIAEEVRKRPAAGTYYVHVLGNTSLPGRSRPWDHLHPYLLQVLQLG